MPIQSEYTINGKTYRNLEAQVKRNQDLSLDAAEKAQRAEAGLAANSALVNEYTIAVTAQLEALDERVWDLETGGSKTPISEPVKSMAGTAIPSAVWSGELDVNTGDYDIYCTIPISYDNKGDYLSTINLATVLFGGPVPVKLPDAIGTSSAKQIFYTVNKSTIFNSAIIGFDLNASPLITNANGWIYREENGFSPWQTYNFNICIHVHGRKIS
jgi:hypothetical protein